MRRSGTEAGVRGGGGEQRRVGNRRRGGDAEGGGGWGQRERWGAGEGGRGGRGRLGKMEMLSTTFQMGVKFLQEALPPVITKG